MSTTEKYLTTLRRIPDDIILSIASREVVPIQCSQCICGWGAREALARVRGVDADDILRVDGFEFETWKTCHQVFGGEVNEWCDVFTDIYSGPDVEDAFVTRVMEAAGVA
jgi:hypothetical protein